MVTRVCVHLSTIEVLQDSREYIVSSIFSLTTPRYNDDKKIRSHHHLLLNIRRNLFCVSVIHWCPEINLTTPFPYTYLYTNRFRLCPITGVNVLGQQYGIIPRVYLHHPMTLTYTHFGKQVSTVTHVGVKSL